MDQRDQVQGQQDGQPYFYFRCPQGHENTITTNQETKYQKISGGQVIVYCQSCSWKSAPFKPTVFQHLSPGNVLLWIYTNQSSENIGTHFRFELKDKESMPMPEQKKIEKTERISIAANESPHDTIEETAEIPMAKTQAISREMVQNIPRIPEQRTHHYFPGGLPSIKLPTQPIIPHIMKNLVWLLFFGSLAFFSLRSCEQQGEKIAQAISHIEMKNIVGNTPIPQQTKISPKPDDGNQSENNREIKEWQKKYQALANDYQKETKTSKELADKIKMLTEHQDNLHKDLRNIQHNYRQLKEKSKSSLSNYDSFVESLAQEFVVEKLNEEEKDFLQLSSSNDGRFLLFYQDKSQSRRVKRFLQIGAMDNGRLQNYTQLFSTRDMGIKQSKFPFVYSWDGMSNIVLLTRLEGINNIYHIKFQIRGKSLLPSPARKITTVSSPEIFGPPALSPNNKYFALVHHIKQKAWIRVYSLSSGKLINKTPGGYDTSRMPVWAPDSKTLFFVDNDGKKLTAWSLAGKIRNFSLEEECYGRYLSCSPDGKQIAFFQKSTRGKGLVNFAVWYWQKNKVKFLQEDFSTTENCKPAWSPKGRFIAIIKRGVKEQIVIQDIETSALFSVFQKPGRITWLDWQYPQAILFSYKEGLFSRPYRIRFISCFTKQ